MPYSIHLEESAAAEGSFDAVGLFESYAADGNNAALKTFAQETRPR
ncbi:hypothetical protein RFM23_13145 [Mesorhizobium abyssinicae]|uniref:Uncharacterized protein n=1 Tax=Mesorhizobium abyssinicae TaxID=1209958 RepID=A0ABU5AMU1_9HYPH|nr:hypothetical protein [Mesorhizobium abyssinicae]MDX8538564.1 hypothetical protein [Mesorhizobium abyssinicae]